MGKSRRLKSIRAVSLSSADVRVFLTAFARAATVLTICWWDERSRARFARISTSEEPKLFELVPDIELARSRSTERSSPRRAISQVIETAARVRIASALKSLERRYS